MNHIEYDEHEVTLLEKRLEFYIGRLNEHSTLMLQQVQTEIGPSIRNLISIPEPDRHSYDQYIIYNNYNDIEDYIHCIKQATITHTKINQQNAYRNAISNSTKNTLEVKKKMSQYI